MAKKKNILFIFTDQQRADTIAALGNPVIKTPNFDRIANEGVAFINAFTPSPVCVSARCSMMYGQYPYNTGCYENTPMPRDGRQSFVGALTEAGYRTHGIGKHHHLPGLVDHRGFESRELQELFFNPPIPDDYIQYLEDEGVKHLLDPYGPRSEMYYIPQPSELPPKHHSTQWVGDRSVDFIEQQADSDQPWFLFSSYIHPHPPISPPSPWYLLYRAPLMSPPNVPPHWESLLTYINRFQNRYKYRDQGIDHNLIRCIIAYYYACVSFIDYQVGRLLETLERTGQLEDTLILCSSDHGELLGDYNSFGKRSMHDGSARIPMLAWMPGRFEGGQVCDDPVSLVDIAPTCMNIAGAKITSHEVDGVDMADVLNGTTDRTMVFSQYSHAGKATYMAVSKKWKYFYSAPDQREFLFDRITDPLETRNRASYVLRDDETKFMRDALIEELTNAGETNAVEHGAWKEYPRLDMPEDPDALLLVQDNPWIPLEIPGYTD